MKKFLFSFLICCLFFMNVSNALEFSETVGVSKSSFSVKESYSSSNGKEKMKAFTFGDYNLYDFLNFAYEYVKNGYENAATGIVTTYHNMCNALIDNGYSFMVDSTGKEIIIGPSNTDIGCYPYGDSYQFCFTANSGDAFYYLCLDYYFIYNYTCTESGYSIGLDYKGLALWFNSKDYFCSKSVKNIYKSGDYYFWDGTYSYQADSVTPDTPTGEYSSQAKMIIDELFTSNTFLSLPNAWRDNFFIIYDKENNKYNVIVAPNYVYFRGYNYTNDSNNYYRILASSSDTFSQVDFNYLVNNMYTKYTNPLGDMNLLRFTYECDESGNVVTRYNVTFPNYTSDITEYLTSNDILIYTRRNIPFYTLNDDGSFTEDTENSIPSTTIFDEEGNEIVVSPPLQDEAEEITWWEALKNLMTSWVNAILTGLKNLFIPDFTYLSETWTRFKEKTQFINQAIDIVNDISNRLELNPLAPPSISIDLSNANSKYNWGGEVMALDLSWYEPYKPAVDFIIICFCYGYFIWNLFKDLPNILAGVAGAGVSYNSSEMRANYISDRNQREARRMNKSKYR